MSARAFETLEAAYRGRDDGWRRWRKAGQPVVGYVGDTVPVEAITASGALAWRVAPVDGDTAAADPWIETFADLDARLLFARYVEGAYDELALLVVPRSSETQHKLFLALREAQRVGLKRGGPALWLHDVLHTQRESSRAYGLARTRGLLARLGSFTGRLADDEALGSAIAATNATRVLLAELQARRRAGRVGGRAAQVATGALAFLPPAEGQAALAAWLAEPTEMPRPPAGPRLLVKGVPLDHDRLHALVEALGAHIVAEDDAWGSRAAEPLVAATPSPLEGLFLHTWRERPCPRLHPPPADGGWFARTLAAGGFDGVLFNHPRPDDTEGWAFPAERERVRAAGLPFLQLRDDVRTAPEAARAALAPFIAGLHR